MSLKKLQIPTGMQDTLPGECEARNTLEERFRRLFRAHGYREIRTPILEYYDTLSERPYGYRPEHVWKTFDRNGSILTVRPDSTIPAARIAAGPLRDAEFPVRLCYLQSAATYQMDTLSMLCEQPQAGVELMGEPGSLADAEVIALAVECLRSAGLRDCQIELGQAAFFTGFLREAGLSGAQANEVRQLVERKDSFGIQMYLKNENISGDVTRRLMQLPRLYGDVSVLDEAEGLTRDPECLKAIRNLREVIDLLEKTGCGAEMTIDLGMAQEAGYYSGIVFRGHAAGAGQPILSGGRYDGLTERFGREMPAVGFALMTKLLMIALERQGERFESSRTDVLIACDPACAEDALKCAAELRGAGQSVAMIYRADEALLRRRLASGDAERALLFAPSGVTEIGKEAEG